MLMFGKRILNVSISTWNGNTSGSDLGSIYGHFQTRNGLLPHAFFPQHGCHVVRRVTVVTEEAAAEAFEGRRGEMTSSEIHY